MIDITTNLYPDIFPYINVSDMDLIEDVAGPGKRWVIWLQGCKKRCPGCANGEFLAERKQKILSVEEIATIVRQLSDLDGITLSGGEPVLQAAALIPLLDRVHQEGLSVACYSGYTLEELQSVKDDNLTLFLQKLDLLIDGEYRKEYQRAGPLRPSANQQVHSLSSRFQFADFDDKTETVFSFSGRQIKTTGTFPLQIRKTIFKKLASEYGVVIKRSNREQKQTLRPDREQEFRKNQM